MEERTAVVSQLWRKEVEESYLLVFSQGHEQHPFWCRAGAVWGAPAQVGRALPCLARPTSCLSHIAHILTLSTKCLNRLQYRFAKPWSYGFLLLHLSGFWIMCLKVSVTVWGCMREWLRGGWVLAVHTYSANCMFSMRLANWHRAYLYCVPQQNLA